MRISILTLFPEFFQSPLDSSILSRAQNQQLVQFELINLRDFASDARRTTDDRPYGGGPGMVMMVEPIDLALRSLNVRVGNSKSQIVLLSARGKTFDQHLAMTWSKLEHLVLICGHYQDVDQRVAEFLVDIELSVGKFVLTGGEPAALVVTDAVTRLLPGVLGNPESPLAESHQILGSSSAPAYTRPDNYKGWAVPQVLLSGDHIKIEEWKSRSGKKSSE